MKLEDHPSFTEGNELRKERSTKARRFILFLWLALVAVVGVDALLHLCASDFVRQKQLFGESSLATSINQALTRLQLDPTNAVDLDDAGRVRAISDADLRWAVRAEQAAPIAASLRERSRDISVLQDKIVNQSLLEFRVRFTGLPGVSGEAGKRIELLSTYASTNNFDGASLLFTKVLEGWTDDTRKLVGERAIFELNYGLEQLARLKRAQYDSLGRNLTPPRMHLIFWGSPAGALLEAVMWSIVGTLVNLIVNSANARAKGKFRPDEIWISVSKLIYGPVLSFVLILAIYFGVLNAGTEVRFWLLPILGFVFGYNTRKVLMLIDKLSEKLLGAVDKSAAPGSKLHASGASQSAAAVQATNQPNNLAEMKAQARRVVDSAVVAAVIQQNKI